MGINIGEKIIKRCETDNNVKKKMYEMILSQLLSVKPMNLYMSSYILIERGDLVVRTCENLLEF